MKKSKPSSTDENLTDPEKNEKENGIYGGTKQIGGRTKSISESKQVGGTTSISGQIEEMERDGGLNCAAASHLPLSRPNKR